MSCDTQRVKNTDHFTLLCSLKYENIIPCSVYRSQITGITVCIAEVDGPFIDGDFNIVTETCDNDGLPYAVRTLILTGSKDYPYKHILNFWAMRSLASNITANNFQERTCFTMRTAGSEGFLNLMPKYLDHILFPSLKDSAYLTEVHHITGEGNNGGVVYCKIQKHEHTSDYIIQSKLLRALYPGICGYNSLIIGTTKNFRESTTNEKVKQFHEKFYRPENLTILITGKLQSDAIFQALLPLEEKIMSKVRKDVFERPWQTPINPLKESVVDEVFFPSDKEEYGEVHVAWRGPSTITDLFDFRGCYVLVYYLTRGPLTKKFGKIVHHSFITKNSNPLTLGPYFEIIIKNIPVDQIDLITTQSIHEVLKNVCTDGINMERIKTIIHKMMFRTQNMLDTTPHKIIAPVVFNHLIYEDYTNLEKRFNTLRELEYLKNKSKNYFLNLLKNYFVDAPMVFIKGKPSLDMYLQLQDEETNVTEQNKTLGRNYLQQKEEELQKAIKEQNEIIPNEKLWKVPMSGIDSLTFYHIERYNTDTAEQHPKLNVKNLPLFTYLDDVDTNFFYLQVVMDTSFLSPEYKLYIPLLAKVITESPVKRGNQLISSKQVKTLLSVDIKVQSYKNIDTSRRISDSISLILQAELHNYEKSVQWCKEFLYDTKLTADNVKVAITQLLNNNKLEEKTLLTILMTTLVYTNDTHWFTDNIVQQNKFLTDIQKRLNTDEGQKEVIAQIEFVRQLLTSSKKMFMYMAVNVNKLTKQVPDVLAPWNKFFSNFTILNKTKVCIPPTLKFLTPSNNYIRYTGCIMGLSWINSSYFIQTCPCINVRDLQHPDLPALKVCLTYFSQQREDIWDEIGEGQAVSDQFYLDTTEDGYLKLTFGPVKNVVAAYETTQSIVTMHLDESEWNLFHYELAKVKVILNYINNVQTIKHVINTSLTSYCRNLPDDYDTEMVRRVSAVTLDDVIRVTNQYVKPMFDPKQCKIAIVCNIDKVAEIKEAFQKMKFDICEFTSLEELKNNIEIRTTSESYLFD